MALFRAPNLALSPRRCPGLLNESPEDTTKTSWKSTRLDIVFKFNVVFYSATQNLLLLPRLEKAQKNTPKSERTNFILCRYRFAVCLCGDMRRCLLWCHWFWDFDLHSAADILGCLCNKLLFSVGRAEIEFSLWKQNIFLARRNFKGQSKTTNMFLIEFFQQGSW